MTPWPIISSDFRRAHTVATEALLLTRDNLPRVIDAEAMMFVHGDAGSGKTLSVNASLRELLTTAMTCRVRFRAREHRPSGERSARRC